MLRLPHMEIETSVPPGLVTNLALFSRGIYHSGEVLFYQNHYPYGAFIILAGSVSLLRITRQGKSDRCLTVKHEPYIMLGRHQLEHHLKYLVSAVALGVVAVLFLDRDLFMSSIGADWAPEGSGHNSNYGNS